MRNNQGASGLKAGNTKQSQSGNLPRSGLRGGQTVTQPQLIRRRPQPTHTGSKTSGTDKQSETIVIYMDKVRTPKKQFQFIRLITEKYCKATNQFFKRFEEQNLKEKQNKGNAPDSKSPLGSASQSQLKNSSLQERSSYISSDKSYTESESDSKKDSQKQQQKKKKHRTLSQEQLNQNYGITLCQTGTNIIFRSMSGMTPGQNQEVQQKNGYYKKVIKYDQYCQMKIGSDNYVKRPVQTFNFQLKQIALQLQSNMVSQSGCFAAYWDILDNIKQQQKGQYQILQNQIKTTVDSELNYYTTTPFSILPLDKRAIDIHSRREVPGASKHISMPKEKRSGLTGGITQNVTLSVVNKDDSSTNQKIRTRNPRHHLQKQIQIDQQKVDQDQAKMLEQILQESKCEPSQQQKRIMLSQNLPISFKYVDRILNQMTYHKQYILYRNYPEVKIQKMFAEDQKRARRHGGTDQKQGQQEQKFQQLQLLFKFNCDKTKGYTVTSADWNPINKDLLAVTYGDLNLTSNKQGRLMFWTLKNPSYPQRIIYSPSRFTCCKFSLDNPNLIACGTYDGVVSIYDIRRKDSKPVAQNRQLIGKHSDVVWQVQWIAKGRSNDKGQGLVSISSDGRITQWSMKKGLEYTDLMTLKRINQPNKKENATESMNFRQAAGLSFQFLKGQNSMYIASTQEGTVHRCSKSYAQQFLNNYFGHKGPIYRVRCNPFFSDLFLTCSADWSCKLWNWRKQKYLFNFQSLDLQNQVTDIEWSPYCSTLFCTVCKDGRIELWDLTKRNMLDPICAIQKKTPTKTMIKFCKADPVLITGDTEGDINVYRLHGYQDCNERLQKEKIIKLIYPNGYNKGGSIQNELSEQKND